MMDEIEGPVTDGEYAGFDDDDQQPYLSPTEKSLLLRYRMSRRQGMDAAEGTISPLSSSAGTGTRYNSEQNLEPSTPPLLLSSPSAASLASSHGGLSAAEAMYMTPAKGPAGLRDGLLQSALPLDSSTPPGFPPSHGRVALARRLGQLAQQLTTGADVDELTLATQLDQLERAVAAADSSPPAQAPQYQTPARIGPARIPPYQTPARIPQHYSSPARAPPPNSSSPAPRAHPFSSPAHLHLQHRPARFSHPARSHSDVAGMIPRQQSSLSFSPAAGAAQPLSLHRSRYSDLSASMLARLSEINAASLLYDGEERGLSTSPLPEQESEPEPEPEPPKKGGMTAQQADKVIAEAAKLNKELSIVVDNLKARLEESDHIHSLLIERAERAAQRIIFLQNRISYLEEELEQNDEELQHLRICLKAVEIQLPPHPDLEIQRCISTFKEDFRALKQKRVNRSSVTSFNTSPDHTRS